MKCSIPYCPNEAVKVVKLKHATGEPEIYLCEVHAEKFKFIEDELELLSETKGFNETYSLFSIGIELLKQALLAFGMGLNETSAIMARASIEAILVYKFVAKDLKFNKNVMLVSYTYDNERLNEIENRKISLDYLIKYAKDSGLLNNELSECADKVRKNGNYVAHLAEQFAKGLAKLTKRPIEDLQSEEENVKIWLSDNEAKDNIICAVKIMKHLIEETYKQASAPET